MALLYCFNLPGVLALLAETVFMRSHPTLHIKSDVIEMTAYMSYPFLLLFERTCCGDTQGAATYRTIFVVCGGHVTTAPVPV